MRTWTYASIVIVGLTLGLAGCADGEGAAARPAMQAHMHEYHGQQGHGPAGPDAAVEPGRREATGTAKDDAGGSTHAIAQTKCPVMGLPINKDIHTDYNGRRAYFCCPACVNDFKSNPEHYLAILDKE